MALALVWSPEAIEDIEAIAAFLAGVQDGRGAP
jgi:plasmid stabilization system protein ParE